MKTIKHHNKTNPVNYLAVAVAVENVCKVECVDSKRVRGSFFFTEVSNCSGNNQ